MINYGDFLASDIARIMRRLGGNVNDALEMLDIIDNYACTLIQCSVGDYDSKADDTRIFSTETAEQRLLEMLGDKEDTDE